MKNLIVIVLLASSGFSVYQYALPAWANIKQYQAEIKKVDNVEAEAKDIVARRNQILERFNNVKDEDLNRLNLLLPRELTQEDLYVFFKKIIETSGMSLKSIDITAAADIAGAPKGGYKSLGFSFEASGDYRRVRALMDALENNLRLMDIDTIDITQADTGGYLLKLKGKMYYGS
jgi:Tfp pilus assembly protein PilN